LDALLLWRAAIKGFLGLDVAWVCELVATEALERVTLDALSDSSREAGARGKKFKMDCSPLVAAFLVFLTIFVVKARLVGGRKEGRKQSQQNANRRVQSADNEW
jgi:hypothetical protein